MTACADGTLLKELLTLEHRVWQALVEGDAAADAQMLAEDFLGVYPTGFAGRLDHIGQLQAGATVERYEIGETRILKLGQDYACLSYHARYLRPGQTNWEAMYVSSIWQRQTKANGSAGQVGWVNIFSQDTVADGAELV